MDIQVERGAEIYRENGVDAILAIGGGNSLDFAKSIAIIVSNGGKIRDYQGANRFCSPLPPMMFITTVAGSGLDFSRSCIIVGWLRLQYIPILNHSRSGTILEGVN
jgi:alcohol dehydrogenase